MRFSTTSGSAGDTTSGAALGSRGKYVSTTVWDGDTINDLFPDLSPDDNENSVIDYRCVFILNDNASLTLSNTFLWLGSQVAGGADIAVGLDPVGVVAKGSGSVQAATIANVNTAPSGVTFSAPTTKGTGLSIGNLDAGEVCGIWIRRTGTASGSLSSDGVTLHIAGEDI